MSAKYSEQAMQLSAQMDKNTNVDQLLLSIEYIQRSIAISNLWIEAYMFHLNTVALPNLVKSIKEPTP